VQKSTGAISLWGALAIGIGGMVGGGIFAVLGEAVLLAHGSTPIAFAIGGVVAALTSYAYARLSVHFPSEGGTVTFIHEAFGVDLLTGSINLLLWLGYLVTLALYASAFGAYAQTFFHDQGDEHGWLRHVLMSVAILLPLAVNLISAKAVGESETLVVVLKLMILVLVIVAGMPFVDTVHLAVPHAVNDLSGMLAAAMVIFVAYEGFELIANAAGDIRNPQRNLPLALYGSVGIVAVLYILIAVVVVGTVPADRVAAVSDFVLAEAAQPALGHAGFVLVAVAALLATLSAINATLYGDARLGSILARYGELPEFLRRRRWHEPVFSVLLVGALALLITNTLDLHAISILASASFLLIFVAVNAAAFFIGPKIGARRWITAPATLATATALTVLMVHSYRMRPGSLWLFVGFVLFSMLFEFVYRRWHRAQGGGEIVTAKQENETGSR